MTAESRKKWFIYDYRAVVGPMSAVDVQTGLESGRFEATDLYWTRGLKEWAALKTWSLEAAQTEDKSPAWYLQAAGLNDGPYTLDEVVQFLKADDIPMTAQVWTTGFSSWQSIYQTEPLIEELGMTRRKHQRVPLAAKVRIQQLAPRASVTSKIGAAFKLAGDLKTDATSETAKALKESAPSEENGDLRTGATSKANVNLHGLDFEASVISISSGGLGIKTSHPHLKLGQEIRVTFEDAAFGASVDAQARIVYSREGETGLAFTFIPAESTAAVVSYIKSFEV